MFNFIRRLWDWIQCLFWRTEMEITVLGLQGAGKTTFVNLISKCDCIDTIPTIGFNMRKVNCGKTTIKVWDLGGEKRFRSMWERYCRGVNAILYMIDVADRDKIEESRDEWRFLIQKPQLANIPILILGNKTDLPNTLDQTELINYFELNLITDREVSCYMISCKNTENVDNTLQWLIDHSKSSR